MSKLQLIVVLGSCLLFLGIYFGTDTKPSSQEIVEKTRAVTATSTSIDALLQSAKQNLSADTLALIGAIEKEIAASQDTSKVAALKRMAGLWYDAGRADISGHYAQEVAELVNDEAAWSIAGTTYVIGARQAKEEKILTYCITNARQAMENAISINPSNYANKVNLALTFIDFPSGGNPMKGILMLREYNEQAPENVLVLNTLARLAIQTNQFEKAIERLNKVVSIEPDNRKANCLLVQAYDGLGNKEKAAEFAAKCID